MSVAEADSGSWTGARLGKLDLIISTIPGNPVVIVPRRVFYISRCFLFNVDMSLVAVVSLLHAHESAVVTTAWQQAAHPMVYLFILVNNLSSLLVLVQGELSISGASGSSSSSSRARDSQVTLR